MLAHAERLGHGGRVAARKEDDYRTLLRNELRQFLRPSPHRGDPPATWAPIGIMGARLVFRSASSMSADARAEEAQLHEYGVTVVEYAEDYGVAVAQGAGRPKAIPYRFFIDDENSPHLLFLGYAVAGERVKAQFDQMGIRVDAEHPLFVYLPCGVGGGPGGVAFGLKPRSGTTSTASSPSLPLLHVARGPYRIARRYCGGAGSGYRQPHRRRRPGGGRALRLRRSVPWERLIDGFTP